MTKPNLLYVSSQLDAGLVKQIHHTDGKQYLVAPTVAIVEGVMNNILYLGDHINEYIETWNGKPLIVHHPEKRGEFVSANNPDFLPEILGFYFNATYDNNRLMGEWWLDIEKCDKSETGRKILIALQSGKMLEQSTGLFADIREKPGEFNGVPYVGIAEHIRPDHVAILLNETGACSIADGCGTPRINTEDDTPQSIVVELKDVVNGLKTHYAAFAKFIKSIKLFNMEDNQMTREEMVNWILENSPIPLTAAMLEVLSDEDLQALADGITPVEEPAALTKDDEENPETNDTGTLFTTPSPRPPTEPEPPVPVEDPETSQPFNLMSVLPESAARAIQQLSELDGIDGLRQILDEARSAQVAQFDALSEMLVNRAGYTAAELKNIPISTLQKMVDNLPHSPAPYMARTFGANSSQRENEWAVYEAPENGGR